MDARNISYSCKYPHCKKRYYKYFLKNKHFFNFPIKPEERRKQWFVAMNSSLEIGEKVQYNSTKRYYLCEDHFGDNHFTSTLKTRISRFAVPTIFHNPRKEQTLRSSTQDSELCDKSRTLTTTSSPTCPPVDENCGVHGCQPAKDSTLHYFPDPDKYPTLFLSWIRLMANSNLLNKEANVIFKTSRICSNHFVFQDFLPNGSLKEFVSPTLHLPLSALDQLSTTQTSDLLRKASLGDTSFNLSVENKQISPKIIIYDVSNILPSNASAGSTDEIYEDSSDFQLVDDPETLSDSADTPVPHLFSNQSIESYNILPHKSDYNSNKCINQNELDETGNYIVSHPNVDHLYSKTNDRIECQESRRSSKIQSKDSTNFLQDNVKIEEAEILGEKPYFKSLKNFSQEHNCVTEVCRICFNSLIDADDAIKLYEESLNHNTAEIKNMVKLVLPDLEMELYSNTVICLNCHELLLHSYELKAKWLLTEQKLQRIIEKEHSQIKRDGKLIIIEQKEKTHTMDNGPLADHHYTNKIDEDSNKIDLEEIVEKILTLEGDKTGKELHIYHDDILNEPPTNILNKKVSKVWGPGPYLCEICGATYQSTSTIRSHLFRHTHPRKIHKARQRECICEVCGKLFGHERALTMHSRKHKNHNASHNVYNCSLCNKVFTQKWRLNYHIKCKHTKTFYQCHICGKRLSSKSSWTQHSIRHSPLKKIHSCHICDKKFYCRVSLKRHISSHVKERLLKCKYCGKNLKHDSSLRKHIAIFHLGQAKCVCECCNKVYWKNWDLKKHYIRVHGRSLDSNEIKQQMPVANIQDSQQN